MHIKWIKNSVDYHNIKEKHILVSCDGYYNNKDFCCLHLILEKNKKLMPDSITYDSARLLVDQAIENKNKDNLMVVVVSKEDIMREVYLFLSNVFGGTDFDYEPNMKCYLELNKVWQKRFTMNIKKKWSNSETRKYAYAGRPN